MRAVFYDEYEGSQSLTCFIVCLSIFLSSLFFFLLSNVLRRLFNHF